MSAFSVDVLTPSRILAKDVPGDDIMVPTTRGLINILKGHTHIVTQLAPGELVIKTEKGEKVSFVVTSGICKVLKNKITILSTAAERAVDINADRAEKAFNKAKDKLTSSLSDEDLVKYQRKIERASLRLKLAREVLSMKENSRRS